MDFIGLLGHVPPLLHACVDDNTTVLRILRLVSKEASRVALLALRSYTLTLEGLEGYNTASGASLLRSAHLQKLDVSLRLSGSFSPAAMLEAFVRGAEPALSTLTSLTLRLQDRSNSAFLEAGLSTAMTTLVSACPVLRSFSFKGHLTTSFIRSLGKSCLFLSHMTYLSPRTIDQAFLQQVLQLQPSLLPHITNLTLNNCGVSYQLSDMSLNTSISTLDLDAWEFSSSADWLLLPPKLKHLKCWCVNQGPPTSLADKGLLGGLATLELLDYPPTIPLHAMVQLLQAAPALNYLNHSLEPSGCSCIVDCFLLFSTSASTVADLVYLHSRFELPFVMSATYNIICSGRNADESSLCPVIALLPVMTGIAKIVIYCLDFSELSPLLNLFPDATDLGIEFCNDLTDVQLQAVTGNAKLTCLRLKRCNTVTPMGLFAVCRRLPCLADVACEQCDLLSGAALDGCAQLLQNHGSLVKLVEIGI